MPSSLLKKLVASVKGKDKEEDKKAEQEKKEAKKATKKKTAKKAAKKTTKKTVKKTAKKTAAKKTTKKSTKKSTPKKTTKKPVKKTTKKKAATKKTTKKKAAKKTTKKATKKTSAKKTVKKTAKNKVAKKSTKKETAKKAAKKTTKKTATKPVKKQPAKKPKEETLTPRIKKIPKRKLESLQFKDPQNQPWLPERSKIKAAIENGLSSSYLHVENMLYLGAAHGYTISQIYTKPMHIYAVEKSEEMMRHFLPTAEKLSNVLPILGDATAPDSYSHHFSQRVDLIFQDIAQKDQVGIFLSNCDRFLAPHGVGLLVIKAPAISSTAEPASVFAEQRKKLEAAGCTVVQEISLEPYQKDHRLFVVHQNPYADW